MENAALQNMLTRYSCRNYLPDLIKEEELDTILKAGTYAPTGKGLQAPVIIAVTNKELRDRFAEENRIIQGAPEGKDPFYGAPIILAVLADPAVAPNTYLEDGACVCENLMLAAHSLGIGSCWIHRCRQEFERDFGKALLKELGLSDTLVGVGHVAIGYPAKPAPETRPARKDGYVVRVK